MKKLNEYGWNAFHETNWQEMSNRLRINKCVPGRVVLEHKRMYRVVTPEGEWFGCLFRKYAI